MYWLEKELVFPHPSLSNEDGLLAVGGDLSPERILLAYKNGIFPWFNPGELFLWWSPNPRFVIFPEDLKVSKSMRPYFNQKKFSVKYDTCFEEVIVNCSQSKRKGQNGTWITDEMIAAYVRLHEMGWAHSVEVYSEDKLVGGLYGIAIGKVFFGESMFAKATNASKFGFISLVRQLVKNGYTLIDCQQETPHLASLGASSIPRKLFLDLMEKNNELDHQPSNWANLFAE